jgi:hypothetical protein
MDGSVLDKISAEYVGKSTGGSFHQVDGADRLMLYGVFISQPDLIAC